MEVRAVKMVMGTGAALTRDKAWHYFRILFVIYTCVCLSLFPIKSVIIYHFVIEYQTEVLFVYFTERLHNIQYT